MNIDQRAQELADEISKRVCGHLMQVFEIKAEIAFNFLEPKIKSAIQSVRDETLEETLQALFEVKTYGVIKTIDVGMRAIRALKERKDHE